MVGAVTSELNIIVAVVPEERDKAVRALYAFVD